MIKEPLVAEQLPVESTEISDKPFKSTSAPIVYSLIFNLAPQIVTGIVDLPASKFMKDVMGMSATMMAAFGVAYSIPGYFAPAIGYLRDRWSPFQMGDRGYYLLATPLLICACLWNGLGHDTYGHFLVGAIAYAIAFLVLGTVGNGLNGTLSKRYEIGPTLASATMIGIMILGAACSWIGGIVADRFDYRPFLLVVAGVSLILGSLAFWKPKKLDLRRDALVETDRRSFLNDVRQIFRQRSYWAIVIFASLWAFCPVTDTIMLYFWRDHLHFSMEQIGRLNGVMFLSNLPPIFAYAFLVKRFDLRLLMGIAVLLSTFEYVPLLFTQGLGTSYIAVVSAGSLSAFVKTALCNLQWRLSPPGLEGSSFALCGLITGVFGTLSGLLGASLLDRLGLITGFTWDVLLISAASILMLPFLFLVPRSSERASEIEAVSCAHR